MFKKIMLGAGILFIGFIFRTIKTGEKILWEEIVIFLVVALVAVAFKVWTDIPYDWDKHKNKEKKNLG